VTVVSELAKNAEEIVEIGPVKVTVFVAITLPVELVKVIVETPAVPSLRIVSVSVVLPAATFREFKITDLAALVPAPLFATFPGPDTVTVIESSTETREPPLNKTEVSPAALVGIT